MKKIITEEQVKRLLAYLYNRPYQEVAILIAHLSQLPDLESKNGGQKDTKQK